MNIRRYEQREEIASYRHKQSLLRSKLLNFNTLILLIMVSLFAAGSYQIFSFEQALMAKIEAVLTQVQHPQPHH